MRSTASGSASLSGSSATTGSTASRGWPPGSSTSRGPRSPCSTATTPGSPARRASTSRSWRARTRSARARRASPITVVPDASARSRLRRPAGRGQRRHPLLCRGPLTDPLGNVSGCSASTTTPPGPCRGRTSRPRGPGRLGAAGAHRLERDDARRTGPGRDAAAAPSTGTGGTSTASACRPHGRWRPLRLRGVQRRLHIGLGDVMGKGTGAALVGAGVRAAVRSTTRRSCPVPTSAPRRSGWPAPPGRPRPGRVLRDALPVRDRHRRRLPAVRRRGRRPVHRRACRRLRGAAGQQRPAARDPAGRHLDRAPHQPGPR